MTNRKILLQKLIKFDAPIARFMFELNQMGWDSKEDLVILNRKDIIYILQKYIQSELTELEIEEWANLLESREDIGFETGYENIISEAIFILANPDISYHLNTKNARELINQLS